jgi:acyl carrier protein
MVSVQTEYVSFDCCVEDPDGAVVALVLGACCAINGSEEGKQQLSPLPLQFVESEKNKKLEVQPLADLSESYIVAKVLAVAARLMGEIVDDDQINNDSNLLEAGLDSLGSIQLSSQLSTIFGISLLPTLIFECTTISAISNHIHEALRKKRLISQAQLSLSHNATMEDGSVLDSAPVFANYFSKIDVKCRLLIFPALGQPYIVWHDFAKRLTLFGFEVHVVRFPGMIRAVKFMIVLAVGIDHLRRLFVKLEVIDLFKIYYY